MKALVTFPVVNKQLCSNCRTSLSFDTLYTRWVDMEWAHYDIPSLVVKCPVCKTLIQWETRCN